MKTILILYLLNSALFLLPFIGRFNQLIHSPSDDERFYKKFGVFVFSVSMLAAMWLCYFKIREAAWFFFAVALWIDLRIYFKNTKR